MSDLAAINALLNSDGPPWGTREETMMLVRDALICQAVNQGATFVALASSLRITSMTVGNRYRRHMAWRAR